MPRPVFTTRDRIILAAVELFYSQGYEATGMAQILKKSHANSGSFYFFFKSKEQLLDAVLDWYLADLEPIILRPVYTATVDPIERVFLLLDGYRQKILMTSFTFTCPIGRLALRSTRRADKFTTRLPPTLTAGRLPSANASAMRPIASLPAPTSINSRSSFSPLWKAASCRPAPTAASPRSTVQLNNLKASSQTPTGTNRPPRKCKSNNKHP